jgi:hypothetical protein
VGGIRIEVFEFLYPNPQRIDGLNHLGGRFLWGRRTDEMWVATWFLGSGRAEVALTTKRTAPIAFLQDESISTVWRGTRLGHAIFRRLPESNQICFSRGRYVGYLQFEHALGPERN